MDNKTIENYIRKQKVAFICSIDEEGFPNVKAMLKPRKMDGLHHFYFSTTPQGITRQVCLCRSAIMEHDIT